MIKSKKLVAVTSLILSMSMLMACAEKEVGVKEDEQLTEPVYETQEMTVDILENEDMQIIDGYEVFPLPGADILFYVARPHITKVKGINYWGDEWYDLEQDRYKEYNCPKGAVSIGPQHINIDEGWQFGTQPDFGLNKPEKEDETIEVLYNPVRIETLGYTKTNVVTGDDPEDAGLDYEYKYTFDKQDIQCVQVALYEEFYKDMPEFTFKVYGIPRSVWVDKFDNDMKCSYNQYRKFMQTNRDNNYKDYVLLSEQKLSTTGVYYIDYTELNKKGDFINYLLVGEFSKSCEYTYCVYTGDTYTIKDRAEYNTWKQSNKDKFIAGK